MKTVLSLGLGTSYSMYMSKLIFWFLITEVFYCRPEDPTEVTEICPLCLERKKRERDSLELTLSVWGSHVVNSARLWEYSNPGGTDGAVIYHSRIFPRLTQNRVVESQEYTSSVHTLQLT